MSIFQIFWKNLDVKIVKLKWEFVVSKGSIGTKVPEKFLISVFLSVSSQGNGRKIFGTNQPSMMQTVWSFLTFLADALSNTMKMIQTFFTKVHTWKDTVHSNYTAILMRKEGENRHHFSYCCWCLIIIKSFQKENSHALVLHCQMQMLLFSVGQTFIIW